MPRLASSTPRILLLGAVLVACVGIIGWKGARLLADNSVFPPDDFVEYWAAGSLNANGLNPYDGAQLIPLERRAGRDTDEAVMMWNPPWTLSLAMPIGVLAPRVAQLLWLAISLVLVVLTADMLWNVYGGPRARRWVAWLLALTFMPTLFVLHAGQIGPFILLGIAGFLVAERAGRPWLAGAAGVLIAVKPHLVYLFWIALAAWAVRRPLPTRWKFIAGGIAAGLTATAIPLAFNPQVIDQYRDAMTHRTPEQWKSPTLGSVLREVFGPERFDLQFVPMLFGLAWFVVVSWRMRKRKWDWADRMPMLLLVSFVTASYGAWPFDLVILLPAVIHVAATLNVRKDQSSPLAPREECKLAARDGSEHFPAVSLASLSRSERATPQAEWTTRTIAAIAAFVLINGIALAMNLSHCTSETFVWMAPSLLITYAFLRPGRPTP